MINSAFIVQKPKAGFAAGFSMDAGRISNAVSLPETVFVFNFQDRQKGGDEHYLFMGPALFFDAGQQHGGSDLINAGAQGMLGNIPAVGNEFSALGRTR
jgi:hypothetical protein